MQDRLHDSLKALEVQVGILNTAVTTVTAMSRSIDIYENGVRSEKEGRYKEAAQHYREAADAGVAEAQFRLGQLYFAGKGVDQDISQATVLYEQAALMGIQDAKDALADISYKGHGVERDPSRAMAVLSLLPQSKKQLVQFEVISRTLSGPEYQRAAKLTAEYQKLQKHIVLGFSNLEGG